jgi:hypothetical protein
MHMVCGLYLKYQILLCSVAELLRDYLLGNSDNSVRSHSQGGIFVSITPMFLEEYLLINDPLQYITTISAVVQQNVPFHSPGRMPGPIPPVS